ncbi:hypothetical protein D3C86_1636600 [compost metagenome]
MPWFPSPVATVLSRKISITAPQKATNHAVICEAVIEPLCALAIDGWFCTVERARSALRSRQCSMLAVSIVSRSHVG